MTARFWRFSTGLGLLALAGLLVGCSASRSAVTHSADQHEGRGALARPGSAPQIAMAWKPPARTAGQPILAASDLRRPAVLSMAAGDELGMRFYTQSVLIARAQHDRDATLASAQEVQASQGAD